MKGLELKEIVEKIKSDTAIKDEDIAKAVGRNRSYMSRTLNDEANVAPKLLKKFKDNYPGYFFESNNSNKKIAAEPLELMYDSKEGVLRLLKQSLDENARHAAANEKNASAHEKNATSLQEVVKLLGLKLNSGESGSDPLPDQDEQKGSGPDPLDLDANLSGRRKPVDKGSKRVKRKGI